MDGTNEEIVQDLLSNNGLGFSIEMERGICSEEIAEGLETRFLLGLQRGFTVITA